MNNRSVKTIGISLALLSIGLLSASHYSEDWGFFGHRRINRMAVFTLPMEMNGFFKRHIEYLTEHAVDPDKRRYATKHEAVRHYIDIDHWGQYPFPEVPRDWTSVLMKYTDLSVVTFDQDTVLILGDSIMDFGEEIFEYTDAQIAQSVGLSSIERATYKRFFTTLISPQYYDEKWTVDCELITQWLGLDLSGFNCQKVIAQDRFSSYGILPYHLVSMQRRLQQAFEQKSPSRILRLCAEMGHYIGDAHVPLHTTENYNGQLTNQVGIHAFWESRIPELFADQQYDFFVGPATYIVNPQDYYWKVVLDSHALLDSVLLIEKELSETFPQDKQYCYEERLDITIRTQCQDYARAYHERMSGMVESRMRASVQSIGSSWYTAWVDAGQPDLDQLDKKEVTSDELDAMKQLDALFRQGDIKGRSHDSGN